jgi:hypothetical protein
MRTFLSFVLLFGGAASGKTGDAKGGRPAKAAPRLRLLVPAYFYPGGQGLKHWDRLLAAAANIPIVAVVNPASGPGKKADPNYRKIFARAKKTQITLIGYVATSYGKRPLKDVKAEVDQWTRFYPGIRGIFFDEQPSGADRVNYMAALYKYVRETKQLAWVVGNPGTVCDEKYLSRPAADVVCLFEGPKPFDPSGWPKWVGKYLAAHGAVVSYKVTTAKEMRQCLQAAVAKKVGFLYVTDAAGANPYDRLPGYWKEEVAAVRAAK